jgi:hypothetical protein
MQFGSMKQNFDMLYKGREIYDESVMHAKEEHQLDLHVVYVVFTEGVLVTESMWYILYTRFPFFLGGGGGGDIFWRCP